MHTFNYEHNVDDFAVHNTPTIKHLTPVLV